MKSLDRPNVLILHTDQQRRDTLRCMGNELMHTPNLDKLAAEGAMFTNCFVNNPVCMPSRTSLMTEQYPSSLGCAVNGIALPEDTLTINRMLKPYGASILKLDLLNGRISHRLTQIFTEFHRAFCVILCCSVAKFLNCED